MQHIVYMREDLVQFYEEMRGNIQLLIKAYYLATDADDVVMVKMESGLVSQILLLEQLRKRFNLQEHGDFDEFLKENNVGNRYPLS